MILLGGYPPGTGQKQFNYLLYFNDQEPPYSNVCTAKYYTIFGPLYQTELMGASPRTYYCPGQKIPRFQFATSENPWPPVSTNSGNQKIKHADRLCLPTPQELALPLVPHRLAEVDSLQQT